MDNSDYSRNRGNDYLGVNKIGKNIRKSPFHQPNYSNSNSNSNLNPQRQQPQPQVYNINKNDFQSIVQQLTGSPSRNSQEPHPRPPLNPPKPSSMRLQRIRPSPLTPLTVARLLVPPHGHPPPQPPQAVVGGQVVSSGETPGWSNSNTEISPISAYMRYLQHSIVDSAQNSQGQSQSQQQQSPGLIQYPLVPPLPSPRMGGTSPLASPSGYLNLLSPRSPYPLLSPGYHHPPPLTPNFSFSPMTQPGFMGAGPPPPLSPGMGFPSPGFFSITSPRWRD